MVHMLILAQICRPSMGGNCLPSLQDIKSLPPNGRLLPIMARNMLSNATKYSAEIATISSNIKNVCTLNHRQLLWIIVQFCETGLRLPGKQKLLVSHVKQKDKMQVVSAQLSRAFAGPGHQLHTQTLTKTIGHGQLKNMTLSTASTTYKTWKFDSATRRMLTVPVAHKANYQ